MGRQLSPSTNQSSADVVMTPEYLAKEIIKWFNPWGIVLDPCRGEGAFYNNFGHPPSSRWCEISEGKDFKDFNEKVSWIITNPPWSQLPFFLEKGMQVSENIVYLAPITNFVTRKRLKLIRDAEWGISEIYGVDTPPKPWPQSGFQLAAVCIRKYYKGDIALTGTLRIMNNGSQMAN